jgi:hypothetical protein
MHTHARTHASSLLPSRRSGLDNNALGGTLPDFLGMLPALTALQLSTNFFIGAHLLRRT